jgi:hypothetical protein
MAADERDEETRMVDELTARLSERLPSLVRDLIRNGVDMLDGRLLLECSLRSTQRADGSPGRQLGLTSVDVEWTPPTPIEDGVTSRSQDNADAERELVSGPTPQPLQSRTGEPAADLDNGVRKRRKATGGLRVTSSPRAEDDRAVAIRRLASGSRVFPQRKKRLPDNPALQPSTWDKFIGGIWDSIYSGVRLDPNEVIEQWQALEASG